ncbi:MAG: hypothetical protein U9R37_07820 [Campylobacterota bacterium]|nr:hypothetical protein [Campylobacterota bacterium]
MKKLILTLLTIAPLALFGSDQNVTTDIVERSVNFVIFIAIIYYLLADKLKTFFIGRTEDIQSELDKVQDMLKESETKVADAKQEIEKSKQIANQLIDDANNDVDSIKRKIEVAIDQEISSLEKSFSEKTELETKKAKKLIVENVLNKLLSDENIAISDDELANIVLKKVA